MKSAGNIIKVMIIIIITRSNLIVLSLCRLQTLHQITIETIPRYI